MSAAALESALRAIGIRGTVAAEGSVALLRVDADDTTLADAKVRQAALALAGEHGFRNLALEVSG